jgi:hypothetical protein
MWAVSATAVKVERQRSYSVHNGTGRAAYAIDSFGHLREGERKREGER